jgi:hypothetical protein
LPPDRSFKTASSASVEQGLCSLGLAANAAGNLTSVPYPVTKTKRIFSASSRSATAKLFSRTSPTSSSAKSGARSRIMSSALATLAALRTVFTPNPRIMSSKPRAMIGSSSTINTSLGKAGGASGETGSMISLTSVQTRIRAAPEANLPLIPFQSAIGRFPEGTNTLRRGLSVH